MAAVQIFPLVFSTSTFVLSASQYTITRSFLSVKPSLASQPLAPFLQSLVSSQATAIAISVLVTTATGLYSYFRNRGPLYLAGSILSVLHFAFVPWVARDIRKITHAQSLHGEDLDQKNRGLMKKWMRLHIVRLILVDLPALVLMTVATIQVIL